MNSVVAFPATLSDTSSATAPPRCTRAARAALAECEKIDECKTWSDKAAAIASYARQAKDDGLRVMAVSDPGASRAPMWRAAQADRGATGQAH